MKRGWVLGGAGIGVLALIGVAVALGDASAPTGATAAPAAVRPQVAAPAAAAPSVQIDLFLLPDGAVRAVPGSVRIGLGFVSADNAASAPAQLERDSTQAGASRYEELAIPVRWLSVPAELLADGRVRVGPLQLPSAQRYTLQAQGEDGLRYYMASFTSGQIPASVESMVGAGVRTHVAVEGTHVLLRRVESSVPASAWQRLQEWVAPALLQAYGEEPMPINSGQVLVPLAPGPMEIVLEVNGVEAERRRLTLAPGAITDVRFDSLSQKVAQAVSIDLELEFVKQGSGEAVAGLKVDWLSGRMQRTATTDARGRLTFSGVDRQQSHEFNLMAPPNDGLPEWPELRSLQIEADDLPQAAAPGAAARHRIELAPLNWMIARLPPETKQVKQGRSSPYPIYVLQRHRSGRWADVSADHFTRVPQGLAVSVAEPGTYRVAAVLAPWRVLESAPARVSATDRPMVEFPNAEGTDIVLTVIRDGRAVAGAPVHVIGPVGHLPPEVLTADAGGRVTLVAANVQQVKVELPGSDQIQVPLSSPRVSANFGVQRSD